MSKHGREAGVDPHGRLQGIMILGLVLYSFLGVLTQVRGQEEVSFSEGAIVGTRRLLEIPPPIRAEELHIASGNEAENFRLHLAQDIGSEAAASFVYLETTRALDREEESNYELVVAASGVQEQILVKVNILDINDNPPKFDQDEYQVFTNKTTPRGSELLTLKAEDKDFGRNAKVTYHMAEAFTSHFALDRDQGILRTRRELSCPEDSKTCLECLDMQMCSIVVYAKDGGSPQQSAYTVVKVTILNSNDFDPEITIRYFPDQTQPFATLSPNVEPGTSVAALTVSDKDRGDFGETLLEIIGSRPEQDRFVLSSLSQGLYVLRVGPNVQSLSGSDSFNLTVQARDKGNPPRSTNSQIRVVVNEANNHAPEFTRPSYEIMIPEDVDVNSQVIVVKAVDLDSEGGDALVYSIENGNELDWFRVEPLSGLIVTKTALNREVMSQFNLTLRAQDLNVHPKSAFVSVLISVLDVNDEEPSLENIPQVIRVSEDVTPGSEIFTIKASDGDLKENGTIKFSSNASREFQVNPTSGLVTVIANLDRESQAVYYIQVKAQDGGGVSTSAVLTIELEDVNDNSPEFYPSVIVKTIPVGKAVEFSLKAQDPDLGENAKLRYDWVHPTSSLINLNESTGIITVDRRFRSFPLKAQVKCSDSGGRKSRNQLEFVLQEEEDRDRFEPFQRRDFIFEIVEDLSGTFSPRQVGGVANKDNVEKGTFQIIEGDPSHQFALDEDSGILATKGEIDRESRAVFNLVLGFFPSSTRKRVYTAKVNVPVIDVNDHTPQFQDSTKSEIFVSQFMPRSTQIYKVPAIDLDMGPNGNITFALSDPTNTISIQTRSGILALKRDARSLSIDEFVISITVSDQGTPSKFTSRDYKVKIVGENLHSPQFDFPLYEVTVSESLPLNSQVFQLTASDADSTGPNGKVTSQIINGALDHFGIFPDGGIYLKQSLDREDQAFYSIDVLAEDHGTPRRSAHTKVVIYVQDENDNPPKFDRDTYVFYVREGEGPGVSVGRVMASDDDIGSNAELRYYFGTNSNNLFEVNENTGFITTTQGIDRERLVRESGQDYFVLEVGVSDLGLRPLADTAIVNVVVLDVNDNKPEFSEATYRAEVKENVPLGTKIITVYARDDDKNENGQVFFSLEGNDFFKIDETNGEITVAKALDREEIERHNVVVGVRDGGDPSLTSSARLIVTILDDNDNDPELEFSHKDIDMSENFEVGNVIHTFSALDKDSGENAKVKFILGGANHRHIFHLDENTGILSLRQALDRESIDSLSLAISAVDGGIPPRTASATIKIAVLDENDNTPTFPPTTYLFSIQEGVPLGFSIFKAHARDEDQGQNGNVTYELIGGSDFQINPITGEVITATKIDREEVKQYSFTVRAQDHGEPLSNHADKAVSILVEDINDHAPEFESLDTKILMPGSFRGTNILTVQAKDADSSNNGQVVYSLEKSQISSTLPFELNRTSGQLSLSRDVLVSDRDVYNLEVIASDEAVQSVRKSSSTTIKILTGHDRSGPSFSQSTYSASISENSPKGTPVVTVQLEADSSGFEFYINSCVSEAGPDRGVFVVDRASGQLRTHLAVDREVEGDRIHLEIVAISKDAMSTCKVIIECMDENDSSPVFTDDPEIALSEAFLSGHRLGQFKATDSDEDSVVTYKIGVESLPYLEINAQSGELFLTNPIDREEFEYFEVVVEASDGLHTTTWRNNLKVEDVNDNAPEFEQTFFSFDIHESARPGAVIGRLKCRDRDQEARFKDLTFHFTSEWGVDTFTLDPKTGLIALSGSLDFEKIEHYVLMATAVDGGQPPLAASTTVYINVIDINDNPPELEKAVFEVHMLENVAIGSEVTKIAAKDKDMVSENRLEFLFEEGSHEYFDIQDNGVIVTKANLDREAIEYHSLHVIVRDGVDSSALTASCLVQITVDDANDEIPEILTPQKLAIAENSPPNSPIATIKTRDRDIGENSDIHYFLDDSISMRFAIGRIDGVLRSLTSLDREKESSFLLTIKAMDNGSPRLSSTSQVKVEVADENDNRPVFSPKFYSAKVMEDSIPGSVVIDAKATDLDNGKHAELRFAIISGDNDADFQVDEQSGTIIVNKRLDYERKNLYEITLQVQDGGTPPLVDTATLSINILDVNDNAPEFADSPYFVSVLENHLEHTLPIFVLTATDKDDPPFNRLEFGARDDFNGVFLVNSSTGEIFLKEALDREERSKYTLEVTAMDFGTPRLTATGLVEIAVEDVNDNEPQLEHDHYHFSVEENLPPGSSVGLTHAYDRDNGANGKIRYRLAGTEDFGIDGWTGEIKTMRSLDREALSVHKFTVIASDQSQVNPLSNQAEVTVNIVDINDNSPDIENEKTEFYIPPGLNPGDFIFGIFASDRDAGDNAELRYSLRGRDARFFDLDPVTGVGVASRAFQEKISYQVIAVVSDSGLNSLSSEEKIDIFLAKELVVPTFSAPVQAIDVDEDSALNLEIARFKAVEGSGVAFGIGGGNTGESFKVNASTGALEINRPLDYEDIREYDLWIKLHFEAKPLFFTTSRVRINIRDKNDNPPTFENTVMRVKVPEEQFPPFQLMEIYASDLDNGVNGEISYELVEPSNIFEIDSNQIICKARLDREKNSQYHLKVLATDHGVPRLSSTASVLIEVEDINDNAPLFTRLYAINVTENTPNNKVLLKVETRDADSPQNANVSYSLLDQGVYQAFQIDRKTGELSTIRKLDREVQEEHYLKVQASDGAWKLDTTITVTVLDENDNWPVFDQDTYEFTYPFSNESLKRKQSVGANAQVGRVHALDRDSPGPNSAIVYSLSHSSEFFQLDGNSGQLSVRSALPFTRSSMDNVYQMRVLATDLGSPPRSSECQVRVKVVPKNRYAPQFVNGTNLEIAIPVSLPANAVIGTLKTEDADSDSVVYEFNEASNAFVSIERETGVLRLKQNADAIPKSATIIRLRGVDDGFPSLSSEVTVKILVTAKNQNPPRFPTDSLTIFIREDEPIGNVIATVKAEDPDEGPNGELEYAMVGERRDDDKFEIDPKSGEVKVKAVLDFESVKEYLLTVEARDLAFHSKSASSRVKVILQDVNDHAPEFKAPILKAFIKENSKPGTIVTRLEATDLDSDKFAEIEFAIEGGPNDGFAIDKNTGIITSRAIFDYETEAGFNLTVSAFNPDDSRMKSTALIQINILGENEFIPKFKQPVFQFVISESSQVGNSIGFVEAEDDDGGPEGEVFYYFVGVSNLAGFAIDHPTGEIFVNDELDRESQNRYVLTVLAKNRGGLRGNDLDEAQVIIQVQDGNDPPVFRKKTYKAVVREDLNPGARVATVSAVDKDVRPRNSHFTYSLAKDGSSETVFTINPTSGVVQLARALDREDQSEHRVVILAIDSGSPPATGTTTLAVEVEDINDTPPEVTNLEGFVKENSPPGSFIMKFKVTDADLEHNGPPFHYQLLPSPYKNLVTLDEAEGILKSTKAFDRESLEKFELDLQVSDSGNPPQSSVTKIAINILDENDNPSTPRDVVVVIKSFEGIFPGGKVVDIRPRDPDLKGDYACSLTRGSSTIFQVQSDCAITVGRIQNGREYQLAIEVHDGRHSPTEVNARLDFVPFSRSALDEAVAIRFTNVSAHDLLGFFESLKRNGDSRKIDLLSMSSLAGPFIQDCLVSLKENDQVLSEPDTLAYLSTVFNTPNPYFDLSQASVKFNPCDRNPCQNGGSCLASIGLSSNQSTSVTEYQDTILNSPQFAHNIKCICSEKYLGDRCQIQTNPCDPSPCLFSGQCYKDGGDFQCLCPPKRGGRRCEEERLDACEPNPCLHGGTCQHSDTEGFFCLCRPGYQGDRCQDFIDVCRKNPCLNGGTCVSLKPNYKCRCQDNFYGNHCELSTFGFEEFSYATFSPLGAVTNDVSIVFTTTKPNSLLLYNFGPSLGGRSDFLAIELVSGLPRFSWGGARTAISRLEIPKRLDTGRWFRITATRNNRVGTLSVEDCTESGEFCKTCHPGDEGCFQKAVGDAGALAFHGNELFLGGLPDLSPILDRSDQIATTDFVGCVKSISIGGNEKSILGKSMNTSGISLTCNQWQGGACESGNECGAQGQCIPQWSRFKCQCGDILADDCHQAFQPFSLTEEQEVVFRPKERFKRQSLLRNSQRSGLSRWKRNLPEDGTGSLSVAFRTLKTQGSILTANTLSSWTALEIQDGKLIYRSHLTGKPEINMTSGLEVVDGTWHKVRLEVLDGVLRINLDGQRVGYEIDSSAIHDFLGPDLEKMVLGNAAESSTKGFRGCFSNFTINGELQSLTGDSQLAVDVPYGIVSTGCDIQILQSAQPQNAVDVGVTIVIVFFVLLICTILISFTVFRLRKKWKEDKEQYKTNSGVYTGEPNGPAGYNNSGLQLQDPMPLNNTVVLPLNNQYKSKIRRPDNIVPPVSFHHQLNAVVDDPLYNSPHHDPSSAEHYDLENASSIAPSDIDIVYHYKGYRNGNRHRGKSPLSPFHKKQQLGGAGSRHQNTPLARLSPSSEMSHNTPRILTLGDLSGKPLPPTLLSEQSERSLHSPVSHMSSSRSSRHHSPRPRHPRGLTSENVARFNQHSVTPPQKSSLVNTLDMVGMGSEALKKSDYGSKTPTMGDVQSSSSSENENDSFTCSEYDYESMDGGAREAGGNAAGPKDMSDASMVFSKLISDQNALSEDEDPHVIPPPPPPPHHEGLPDQPTKTWESLLSWQPTYQTFSGVFRDIAELPFSPNNLDFDENNCRPRPIGDGSRTEQEQYI